MTKGAEPKSGRVREQARQYVADQQKAERAERNFKRGWDMSFRDRKKHEAASPSERS